MTLNPRDPRPIYEQLQEELRRLILTGGLQSGERLPSVRDLAAQLQINPNTIQRAYSALEREGYIYTIAGKGAFVAAAPEVDEGRKERLWRTFDSAVLELRYLGVSDIQLKSRVEGGAAQ